MLADPEPQRIDDTLVLGGLEVLFRQPRGAATARVNGTTWRIVHARSPCRGC